MELSNIKRGQVVFFAGTDLPVVVEEIRGEKELRDPETGETIKRPLVGVMGAHYTPHGVAVSRYDIMVDCLSESPTIEQRTLDRLTLWDAALESFGDFLRSTGLGGAHSAEGARPVPDTVVPPPECEPSAVVRPSSVDEFLQLVQLGVCKVIVTSSSGPARLGSWEVGRLLETADVRSVSKCPRTGARFYPWIPSSPASDPSPSGDVS